MAKKIVGTPFYELKIANPNAIANYNGGQLVKSIGDDMSKFVGKPTQGLVVKESLAAKIVEKVKKDLVAKKVAEPVLRAGVSGKDVVFVVADLKNSNYEESCVLVADYTTLREKLKRQAGTIVNMQQGDGVVDWSVDKLATTTGAAKTTQADVDLGAIKGTAPLVLVAHGDEDKTSTGQIYGKDFAGKTPQQLVEILTKNPDRAKRLSKAYAGTLYLDGCFTAQGSAMQNYTKQVWELLKRGGYDKVTVKGNLGLASVNDHGGMNITTSEDDAKAKRLFTAAKAEEKKINDKRKELRDTLWNTKYGTSPDQDAAFFADRDLAKIEERANAALTKLVAKYDADVKKLLIDVPDLTGQFGLTRLN